MKLHAAAACLALLLSSPAWAGAASVERPDGTKIVYHTDRTTARTPAPVLLLLQGSGCKPVAGDARVLGTAPLLAPGFAVLTIEKYGVAPGTSPADAVEGCSKDYWRGNTLSRRVLDALQVIARLRAARWWNGKLVLFGGSEGGAVAAMLAPLVPETKAVVIRSSGVGVPVAELIAAAVPPPVAAEVRRTVAEARQNPSPLKRFGGASYRWWADAADLTPARMLLQSSAPVLLIQRSRDQFAPVATARAARDLLAAGGKRNLTYREYQGCDHFMVDASGVDRSEQVLTEAAAWLRQQGFGAARPVQGTRPKTR